MNDVSPELVRATMKMRQRAEDRSTRTLMCAGYVRGDGVAVFFPGPEQEPVIVAKNEIEPVGEPSPRECSWCGNPFTEEDRKRLKDGETVTHGICEDCRDENFPPPAA